MYGWIIKYIPLQQGLRQPNFQKRLSRQIIKYIPLQQGLRLSSWLVRSSVSVIIKYIPLQQGLRLEPIANSSQMVFDY